MSLYQMEIYMVGLHLRQRMFEVLQQLSFIRKQESGIGKAKTKLVLMVNSEYVHTTEHNL